MPITVIPADENAGAIAGWQMLAEAAQRKAARLHQERQGRKVAYQALVEKLSDPSTTEEQQNAILTQDPAQFQETYGVPITQVGKDVTAFKGGPATDTPAARKYAKDSGAETTTKRVLVEHPGGTAAEQQQGATLAGTQAGTAAELQKTEYYRQSAQLATQENTRAQSTARQTVKRDFRTSAGKVPTLNETDAFIKGEFDLYPTTEAGKRLDLIREIISGDETDPAVRYAQMSLLNDQERDTKQLEGLAADTRLANARADELGERVKLYQQGIDPDTGKSLAGGEAPPDPREIIAVGKAFGDAVANAFNSTPTAMQTEATGLKGWLPWTATVERNPELAALIFGNGSANPADVRADVERIAGKGRKAEKIMFLGVDKNKIPVERKVNPDEAVLAITQARRQLTAELPPVWKAMEAASPRALIEMVQSNPLLEQAAKAYAPTLAKAIDEARKQIAAERATAGTAAAATADPNAAPLMELRDKLQREIDDIRRTLGGQANPKPRTDSAR
jgi:hypothetical protein